jgi:hypothetical protein
MRRIASVVVGSVVAAGIVVCAAHDGVAPTSADRGQVRDQTMPTAAAPTSAGARAQTTAVIVNGPGAGPALDAGVPPDDAGSNVPSLDAGFPGADAGSGPGSGPGPGGSDAGTVSSCAGQSTMLSPKPGVTAVLCLTTTATTGEPIGADVVTASLQIDGAQYGTPGMITGTLSLDAVVSIDGDGNGAVTIIDETSGTWTRNGVPLSTPAFFALWEAVAPRQTVPPPGATIRIAATVPLSAAEPASQAAAAADPCEADANNLDAAATNYNIAVGGSLLGAAAIGLLEVPTWGAATAGFIGLGTVVVSAKTSYDAACKSFQLCCKTNNWPAGVCSPKGATRRGCKNG